jgi:CheY-like chemotaxis protein
MNGLELMTELRHISRYKTAPVIAITALFTPTDINFLKRKGFDDVVIKPFTKDMLLEKLHSQICI